MAKWSTATPISNLDLALRDRDGPPACVAVLFEAVPVTLAPYSAAWLI